MKILFVLIVSVLAFVLYVRYLERTSIFFPGKNLDDYPDQHGFVYEDVYFDAADGVKINGWFIKKGGAQSTLIFFHGNAGNIADRMDRISLLHRLGVNVFIVDYRGYGNSEGRPTERGIYRDAVGAFDYVAKRGDVVKEKIVAYGVSLGGVAAVDLATKRLVGAVIVESTFSNAKDIARIIYPFVPGFLLKTKMDTEQKIKEVSVPKLFIHSRDDTTVPFTLGRKLYEAAAAPKDFLEIKGGHNDAHIVSEREYRQGIDEFLRRNNLL